MKNRKMGFFPAPRRNTGRNLLSRAYRGTDLPCHRTMQGKKARMLIPKQENHPSQPATRHPPQVPRRFHIHGTGSPGA